MATHPALALSLASVFLSSSAAQPPYGSDADGRGVVDSASIGDMREDHGFDSWQCKVLLEAQLLWLGAPGAKFVIAGYFFRAMTNFVPESREISNLPRFWVTPEK
ncbi:hypothetical protein BKA70DRAFT_1508519 [Coprinopsis sp. MPI-PUGE-AT-0042]|nr:hypothetical protein BKA70DRAFT_1508519 [Coprinopsis sp. MPI-PUGE-AT-0042]